MTAKKTDWKQFFWLDFIKLFELFIDNFENHPVLKKVVYFTTTPKNIQKKQQQDLLLKANRLLNGIRFEVIKGNYKDKSFKCPSCGYTYTIPEEKRTDVNISVQMMRDCAMDNTDILLLVSADSDLIPPIKSIKRDYPAKEVRVFFPPDNFSYDINHLMKSYRKKVILLERNKGKFKASVMPDVVEANGKTSSIPAEWKE